MRSSLELFKKYRLQFNNKKTHASMVKRSQFKDSIEFAGSNILVQKMYEKYQKNKK